MIIYVESCLCPPDECNLIIFYMKILISAALISCRVAIEYVSNCLGELLFLFIMKNCALQYQTGYCSVKSEQNVVFYY